MKRENLMPRYHYIAVLPAVAISFLVQPALAHPKLTATVPAADAQSQPPQEIRLSFNEALVVKFSGLDLKDQAGKRVETGPAASDPKDRKQLIVPVKAALQPGRYTVEWHVVAEDTHRVKGSYSFEVKP
jgi:copper resistance protein C